MPESGAHEHGIKRDQCGYLWSVSVKTQCGHYVNANRRVLQEVNEVGELSCVPPNVVISHREHGGHCGKFGL